MSKAIHHFHNLGIKRQQQNYQVIYLFFNKVFYCTEKTKKYNLKPVATGFWESQINAVKMG